jgi:four helix bundle protein
VEYKFEKLDVWKISLDLSDLIYDIAAQLPDIERFNLKAQIIRACTSISLNIAEGSTSQTNAQQSKFLGYAIRSLIEVIACKRHVERRNYIKDTNQMAEAEKICDTLFMKLQAFKNALK